MNPENLKNSINIFASRLLENDIATDVNHVVSRRLSAHAVSIAVPNAGPFVQGNFASHAEYLHFLRGNQYLALLRDGSLIDISYSLHRGKIVSHRLLYHPCPVDITQDQTTIGDLLDNGPDDPFVGMVFKLRSPIRFDYDPVRNGPDHPSSHVTMNDSDCRISVNRPVSFGHFVHFVFKNMQRNLWDEFGFISELRPEAHPLAADTDKTLHLSLAALTP